MPSAKELRNLQKELNESLIDTTLQQEAEKKARRERNKRLNDYRETVATPTGRRVLWKILEDCRAFAEIYVHGDQGYGTTYNAGRQSIGQELIRDLEEAKPGIIYQMALEAHADKQRNVEEET